MKKEFSDETSPEDVNPPVGNIKKAGSGFVFKQNRNMSNIMMHEINSVSNQDDQLSLSNSLSSGEEKDIEIQYSVPFNITSESTNGTTEDEAQLPQIKVTQEIKIKENKNIKLNADDVVSNQKTNIDRTFMQTQFLKWTKVYQ